MAVYYTSTLRDQTVNVVVMMAVMVTVVMASIRVRQGRDRQADG